MAEDLVKGERPFNSRKKAQNTQNKKKGIAAKRRRSRKGVRETEKRISRPG